MIKKTNPRPICFTIGDLRQHRLALEVQCYACRHKSWLANNSLPFPDDANLAVIGRNMRCTKCGAKGAITRADER